MYCTNCGSQLNEKAVICPNCGVATENYKDEQKGTKEGFRTATKLLMLISCAFSIFSLFIPLAWCLPMTLSYIKTMEKKESVSLGFKICTLLFVNTIAGILMLCEE